MKITKDKNFNNIYELSNDGTLIARIKYNDDTMEIYPVVNSHVLSIMVKGNGFDYDSEEQLFENI